MMPLCKLSLLWIGAFLLQNVQKICVLLVWSMESQPTLAATRKVRQQQQQQQQQQPQQQPLSSPVCGCANCTDEILNKPISNTSTRTCRERIEVAIQRGYTEEHACRITTFYHSESCGGSACDPLSCSEDNPVVDRTMFPCSCHECTPEILSRDANGHSCGERIQYYLDLGWREDRACHYVSWTDFPFVCGPECDPTRCDLPHLPRPDPPTLPCGCEACTVSVLQRTTDYSHYRNGFTCQDRIEYLQKMQPYLTEIEACTKVAGEDFAWACGPECDPNRCHDITVAPTPASIPPPCACQDCTDDVLERMAGSYTCRARIEYLNSLWEYNDKVEACQQVSDEFPNVCGPQCDPRRCDGQKLPSEPPTDLTRCGCTTCNHETLSKMAGGHSCLSRIDWLLTENIVQDELEACTIVAAEEYPTICGPACDPSKCHYQEQRPFCGCLNCTTEIWNLNANGYTCGQRIAYLHSYENYTELAACLVVAEEEFPNICGPHCNPNAC